MGIGNRSGVTSQKSELRTVIYYITNNSFHLAKKLGKLLPDSEIIKYNQRLFNGKWKQTNNIICIMATGIVVRAIAPLLRDKRTDPAVVVLDENGKFAISLLSGHIGGANALAHQIADFLGARAVITTASDVQGKISLDIWAEEKNLIVEDFQKLTEMSARIVNGNSVKVFSELRLGPGSVPDEFTIVDSADQADVIISSRLIESDALFLRPQNLIAGIGCNRGTRKEEIASVVAEVMQNNNLSIRSIKSVASIDLKKDEKGLLDYARDNKLIASFYSADELNHVSSTNKLVQSETVMTATGAVAVAEPAALMAASASSDDYSLIVKKEKRGNVTLAIAMAEYSL